MVGVLVIWLTSNFPVTIAWTGVCLSVAFAFATVHALFS